MSWNKKSHQRLSLIGAENFVVYSPHNSRQIARRRIAGQLSVSGRFWNNWGGSREENAERIYCFLFDADGSTGTIFRGLEGPNVAAVCRCIADPFNLHNSLKMRKTRGHCELTIRAHLILSQPLVGGWEGHLRLSLRILHKEELEETNSEEVEPMEKEEYARL
jgi:hypothetical protein